MRAGHPAHPIAAGLVYVTLVDLVALAQRLARRIQRLLAPRPLQRRAADPEHAGQAAPSAQAQRAFQQALVIGGDAPALQPHTRHLDVLQHAARHKRLVGERQAQRGDVPADQLAARRHVHAQVVFGQAAAVVNRLQRQPFQPRPGVHPQRGALHTRQPFAAVKARGPRRGDQPMRARLRVHPNVQHIAAHHAAGRVHQHVLANAIAFRVQALQHPQRALVAVPRDGAAARGGVIEGEFGAPGHWGWIIRARRGGGGRRLRCKATLTASAAHHLIQADRLIQAPNNLHALKLRKQPWATTTRITMVFLIFNTNPPRRPKDGSARIFQNAGKRYCGCSPRH